jgi:predicted phosphodiesterase
VRVAAIADVHGNPAALQAVLRDVAGEHVDAVVFCGDLVSGPFPVETLELIRRIENASFVRGNGDREVVAAFDAGIAFDPNAPHSPERSAAWVAERLTRADRDFLAAFEDTVALPVEGLGETLFCHGSPRSDLEVVTHLTPDDRLAEFLSGTRQQIVVCGHTHMQFDREVGGIRVLNAGSVGLPYEREPGAYWLLFGPEPAFRRTEYDLAAFVERLPSSGYFDDELPTLLLHPPPPDLTAAYFEGIGPEPKNWW